METAIQEIFELDERARLEARNYPKKRESFEEIRRSRGKHFIGIAGHFPGCSPEDGSFRDC